MPLLNLTIASHLEGIQQIVDSDGGRSLKLHIRIATLLERVTQWRTASLILAIGLSSQSLAAELRFVGIGVTIQKARGNKFRIGDLRAGGPALAAGVLKDDVLLKIDGRETRKLKLDQVVNLISGGPVDSPVILSMAARSKIPARDITVLRKEIVVDCRMYGPLNLTYSGSGTVGRLAGWIGADRIDLGVQGQFVGGMFKGDAVNLQRFDTGNEFSMSFRGYYRGAYIDWWANNGSVYGFQGCIE